MTVDDADRVPVGIERDLVDQATLLSDVLHDAVTALGRVPESLRGVSIYSEGHWSPFANA